MIEKYNQYILPLAFLFAAGALAASMVLSSVYSLVPCELCWYQRILMFPIPILLGIALLRRDYRVYWYVLPLSITGAIVAFYQSLLQWDIVGESSLTCNGLVSCGDAQVEFLGFLTIPFGAFLVFSGISALMIAQMKYGKTIKAEFKAQLELLLRLIAIIFVSLLVFFIIRTIVS